MKYEFRLWIFNRNSRCVAHSSFSFDRFIRRLLTDKLLIRIHLILQWYASFLDKTSTFCWRIQKWLLIFNLWPFNSCDLLNEEHRPNAICKTNTFLPLIYPEVPALQVESSNGFWELFCILKRSNLFMNRNSENLNSKSARLKDLQWRSSRWTLEVNKWTLGNRLISSKAGCGRGYWKPQTTQDASELCVCELY